MTRRIRKLTRLRIDEVSAVDRGAGEGVKVVLMKRDAEDALAAEIAEVKRKFPGIPDDEAKMFAEGRLRSKQARFDDDKGNPMNKLTTDKEWREYLERWIASLSPEGRAWARRQLDLAEAQMAEQERANAVRGSTPRRAVAPSPRQNKLTAVQRESYGSGAKAKSDTLQKIAADFGIQRLAKHLVEHGSQEITEGEFVELVNKHAGQSASKLWSGETEESRVVLKAASVLRQSAYARQAESHMAQARERRLIG
jgi:hypothetical protein